MKQFKLKYLSIALAFVTLLASCSKDKQDPTPDKPSAQRAGIYVINQGNFSRNNSTLTYYDYTAKTLVPDVFFTANATKLGDTGNDIGIYGTKMYIVVNGSNAVDIANAKTAKLTKQLTINQPRYVVFYGSNAFVDSYNGTVSVIDTASLTITKTITVGRNPEQMAISNGKLYVANSGGFDPVFDKTVSVIDLTTLTETKKITVTINPITITADRYNNVYVLSAGDYASVSGGITVINATTDMVKSQSNLSLGYNLPIAAQGDYVYYPTADNKIAMVNAKTQLLERANFITDATVTLVAPYAIAFDDITGEVFIADAKDYSSNGVVYAFDKTGKKQYEIATGVSPGRIAFLNK
jgi:YVTN family beta-propeller protein